MDDAAGAGASKPFALGVAAAAELGSYAPPVAESSAGYVVLLCDIEGVGRAGKVVCARAARTTPWVTAHQARAASAEEVDLAAPFHIVLKD